MKRALVVVVAVVSFAGPAQAQVAPTTDTPVAPLATVSLLQVLSERADALQKRLDLATYGQVRSAFVHLEGAMQIAETPNTLYVQGWELACSFDSPHVVVVVDGVETANTVGTMFRPDVTAAYGRMCSLAPNLGVWAFVDLRPFQPGIQGDGWHTIQLRVYPPKNYPIFFYSFAMVESEILKIHVD